MFYFLSKFFGTPNSRFLQSLAPLIQHINALEVELQSKSDAELRAKTEEFRAKIKQDKKYPNILNDILPEAFAVVREAAKRVLKERHFDVQLMGGIVLHRGMIAEMRTGEGKTLVSTLPAYLNALTSNGVHIITVNEYLATRDAEWMGNIHRFLGLTVGCIHSNMTDQDKKAAYLADITYGTNNEFGFDFLRDNLKYNLADMVQRQFNYAIVDEIDSILIDEARTPLIISGPTEDNSLLYGQVNVIVAKLQLEFYEVDEKIRTVLLTEAGNEYIENILKNNNLISTQSSLYDLENMSVVHMISQALKAHKLFKRDVDYIVKDKKILIIDEFTGRIMEGRRYSDGLHQALEAKEKVEIQNENQTLASITFQNYFRMYQKLAGMTGTAMTEAAEFQSIYKLHVTNIPTNRSTARTDEEDVVYKTMKEKYEAIVAEIQAAHANQQPVLVGTVSVEKSEYISKLLKTHKITHSVLNAKYHAQEAEIIAQAGTPGSVTIATNMAGRGTDIMIGGNAAILAKKIMLEHKRNIDNCDPAEHEKIGKEAEAQVQKNKDLALAAGGLLIIGTERHESRRIDDQLRGRAGRQGDPGRTKFFLSLEDDLMRLFGSEKIKGLLETLGLKDGEAITHPWISKSLKKAQQKVELRSFEIRKNLLQFDDVMNEQRTVVYSQRLNFMKYPEKLEDVLCSAVKAVNQRIVSRLIPSKSYKEEWDTTNLKKEILRLYGNSIVIEGCLQEEQASHKSIKEEINDSVATLIQSKKAIWGTEIFQAVLQQIFLITLDQLWKDHLYSLDQLRSGINLRAYAQKNPLTEYKIEAFALFQDIFIKFEEQIIERFTHMHIKDASETPISAMIIQKDKLQLETEPDANLMYSISKHGSEDIPRNRLCPCGSKKKYKHCHGKIK